ncbi:MAG TPA: MFS transporter [Beutenbergiaceae bacterium]|nr:MFS transporter [Beutenbergiaceae bacterium]
MTQPVHSRPGVPGAAAVTSPPLLLAVAATVLVALNLRIPTTALGPLLPSMVSDTGRGETFLSLLTTIPLALTVVIAPLAPRLAARLGRDRTVGYLLGAIVVGTVVRSIPGDPALLVGTVLLGCAIAVGTVLAPATIAADHPGRRGLLTGMYTMALSLGPALALGLTIPMMRGTGLSWRGTLMLWALFGLLALVLWLVRSRAARRVSGLSPDGQPSPPAADTQSPRVSSSSPAGSSGQVGQPTPRRRAARTGPVVKDPRVWLLALYLGITSLTFYTTSTWLPTSFIAGGLSAGAAGGYTALVNVVAIPFAFLAPLGMRRGGARVLAPLSPLLAVVGIGLLLTVGSGGALAVSLLLGIAQGLCLGVSYGQIVAYATSPEHAAAVSAVASAAGIAIAALGPVLFGFGLEVSGSHVLPMSGLGVVVLTQIAVGLRSGRPPVPS